jgi:hypothetical protein
MVAAAVNAAALVRHEENTGMTNAYYRGWSR